MHSSSRAFSVFKLLIGLAVLGGVLAVAWMVLLPSLVVSTVRSKTGFAVKVDSLSVNPFTAKVHVRGLIIENPAGWPESAFLDLRELRADADLWPLLQGKLVADDVTVDIARVTLVRDQQGAMNALVLKDKLSGPAEAKPAGPPEQKSPPPEFLIRRLNLRFGHLAYIDHSGRKPVRRDYELGLARELRDVDSVADLASPFKGAAFGLVTDLASGLTGESTKLLQDAGTLLKDAKKKAGDTLKGLLEKTNP